MKKEDLLQPEIEKILFEMDFIDKYRNIWEKYDKEDENYKISSKDIITTFQNLNYLQWPFRHIQVTIFHILS